MTERYDDNISILKKIENDDSIILNKNISIVTQINELNNEIIEIINYYKPFIFNMFKDKGTEKVIFTIIENKIKNLNIPKKIYNKFNKDEKKLLICI